MALECLQEPPVLRVAEPLSALPDRSVLRGDEGGVVITEYRWLIGMFDFPDRWISADAIVTWIQAEKMPHQAGRNKEDTVYDMDPLADFQTKWHEKGKVEHGRV